MTGAEPSRRERRILMRCSRCGRRNRGHGDWNVAIKAGVIHATICNLCQTLEENTEAEINEATILYGRDSFGRITGRSKGSA